MATEAPLYTDTYHPGYILQCSTCYNQYRTECVNHLLTELPRYCPYCGHQTVSRGMDSDLDYWYTLARNLGLPYNHEGATLVKEIFDEWPRDEYKSFRDYFEAIMQLPEQLDADTSTSSQPA